MYIYIYIIVMVRTTSRQMPHTEIDDSIKSSRSFWRGGGGGGQQLYEVELLGGGGATMKSELLGGPNKASPNCFALLPSAIKCFCSIYKSLVMAMYVNNYIRLEYY